MNLDALIIFSLLPFSFQLSDCGDRTIQKCFSQNVPGNKCLTTANETCLKSIDWCPRVSTPNILEKEQCTDYSNLMFHSCLTISATIGQFEYLIVGFATDWILAEQFCQFKGYNLISFSDQTEYNNVLKLLDYFRKNPRSIEKYPEIEKSIYVDLTLNDPVAHRCENNFNEEPIYWSGLFFDQNTQTWNYSDASDIKTNIRSMAREIDDVLKDPTKGYVAFFARNFTFDIFEPKISRISDGRPRANIICKKSIEKNNYKRWSGGPEAENFGCITGFQCSGRFPKCLIGPMFENSEVCDGKNDCEFGDDEKTEVCTEYTAIYPDNLRIAHFIPIKRPAKIVRNICETRNFTLPSLHSRGDVEFLLSLPFLYATNMQKTADFRLISQNWINLPPWKILIGIRKKKDFWDDGSKLGSFGKTIRQLITDSDVFLYSSQMIKDDFDNKEQVFVVCQENGAQNQKNGDLPSESSKSYPSLIFVISLVALQFC